MTLVIGIDPSLTATGIATARGVHTIKSSGHDGDTILERAARLHGITAAVMGIVDAEVEYEGGPCRCLIVIEAPAYASKTGKNHERSGLWWLIVHDVLASPNVDVVEVTTNQRMRYATGKGQADKDTVLAAVIRRYPDVAVSNNNEADSLVLRAMGCRAVGEPIDSLPQANLKAMDTVRWPEGLPC